MPRIPVKRRAEAPAAPAAAMAPAPAVAGSPLGAAGWRRLFLGACLALGLVQAYVTVARYDGAKQSSGDEAHYLAMSRGLPLDQEYRIYRWRALTPWIVGSLPSLPAGLLGQYQVDSFKLERARFAAWNTLGNLATAWLLMLLMEGLGFSVLQAGLGALLYFTSFQVVTDGAGVLVDPWSYAAIAACLAAGQRKRWALLGLAFGVGLFFKETVVVAAPMLWLMRPKDGRLRWLALLPGLALYGWFRYVLVPGGQGTPLGLDTAINSLAQFSRPGLWLYLAEEFTLNFLWLAPLAWLGWRDSARFPGLRRMALLLPLLAVTPLLARAEFARPWFTGFPIFIPLAVLGLWRLAGLRAATVSAAA
ncbi:MAG TPA: hypothetical protein VK842_07430 [bacterium]|nr:hypothetical protein [bacterium]